MTAVVEDFVRFFTRFDFLKDSRWTCPWRDECSSHPLLLAVTDVHVTLVKSPDSDACVVWHDADIREKTEGQAFGWPVDFETSEVPLIIIRAPSPRRTENNAITDIDVEFVEESSTSVKPKTYGTPSKLIRDLSGIFDSVSPSGIRPPAMTHATVKDRVLH